LLSNAVIALRLTACLTGIPQRPADVNHHKLPIIKRYRSNSTDIYSGGQAVGHTVLPALPDACEGDK